MGILDTIKKIGSNLSAIGGSVSQPRSSSAQDIIDSSTRQGRTVRISRPEVLRQREQAPKGKYFLRYNMKQPREVEGAQEMIDTSDTTVVSRRPQNKIMVKSAQALINETAGTLRRERFKQIRKGVGGQTTRRITNFIERQGGGEGVLAHRTSTDKSGVKSVRYHVGGGITYSKLKSGGISGKSPGRPRQSYKLRLDPLTGRYVRMPATVIYKRQRLAKRIGSARYQKQIMSKSQYYQQRGIPPQQAAQIEQVRLQRAEQQALQRPIQMPQESPQMPQVQRFPIQQRFIPQQQGTTSPDFFKGGTQVRPKERWLQ